MSLITPPFRGSIGPPVSHWPDLSKGDCVQVFQGPRTVASGAVDMVALDGSVLWLIQDRGLGRTLLLRTDGLSVYRRPRPKTSQ